MPERTARACPILAAALILGSVAPVAAIETLVSCFPSCAVDDGRSMSLVGTGFESLAGDRIEIDIVAAPTVSSFLLEVFDGNTTGLWDFGGVPLDFTLREDPAGDGSGPIVIGPIDGNTMVDNDWYPIPVATGPGATAPSGNLRYRLEVVNTDDSVFMWSNFKLRVTGASFGLGPQAFSFAAPITSFGDFAIIYPNFPGLVPTTYDGFWTFHFSLDTDLDTVTVWDGDLDFGDSLCLDLDTDDPDTPNVGVPDFAEDTDAVPEGVAVGLPRACGQTTGAPNDDDPSPFFARPPNVVYELTDPHGNAYLNPNPSGNEEWEAFRISTAPGCDTSVADVCVAEQPMSGLWTIELIGTDLSNLNAWRFPGDALGVDPFEDPVPKLPPECEPCAGKVSSLVLQYLGGAAALVEVTGRRGPQKGALLFSGAVEPGGLVHLNGPLSGNKGFRGTVGTEIRLLVDGVENARIHTSCSQPIGTGLVAGDFVVVTGSSLRAGPLCPLAGP